MQTVHSFEIKHTPNSMPSVGNALLPLGGQGAVFESSLEEILSCWTRLDGKPRLMIKRDGSLVACSQDVPELIRQHEFFYLDRGKIRVTNDKAKAAFARLFEHPHKSAETFLLPRAGGEGHWIVRASGSGNDVLFIMLQEATFDHVADLPDLGEAFGFTKAESQIVRDMYRGSTPQAIADNYGISIHTVRAHVRRCYDKLQITCREALWHRLSAYQI